MYITGKLDLCNNEYSERLQVMLTSSIILEDKQTYTDHDRCLKSSFKHSSKSSSKYFSPSYFRKWIFPL